MADNIALACNTVAVLALWLEVYHPRASSRIGDMLGLQTDRVVDSPVITVVA